METLAKCEDSDEMQHNAAFHQGLNCLLRLKQPSGTEMYGNFSHLPHHSHHQKLG